MFTAASRSPSPTGSQAEKALLLFDIQVVAVGPSSVILSWAAPTQNEDGSPLTDLAGYRIRYGERSGSYSTTVALTNPGLASHFLDGLVPSTYYFVISAYNARGEENPLERSCHYSKPSPTARYPSLGHPADGVFPCDITVWVA